MKKKKYQQSLLEKTDVQLINLENLTSTIEFSLIEQQVLNGLKNGNCILAEIQKEMSLDEVEKIMQDSADAVAYQNEISEIIGGKLTDVDEDELLRELDEIQQADIEEKLPKVPSSKVNSSDKESTIEEKKLSERKEESTMVPA